MRINGVVFCPNVVIPRKDNWEEERGLASGVITASPGTCPRII